MFVRLTASRALFALLCTSFCFLQQLPGQESSLERGKKLFTDEWEQIEAANKTEADGLGPMFNARSCVACHNQGGVGGAGDNSTNVQVMSVLPRQKSNGTFRSDEPSVQSMFEHASQLHPEFAEVNTTILHRSSTHETGYAKWQSENLGFKSLKKTKHSQLAEKLLAERTKLLNDVPVYRVKKENARNRYTLQISRRNTPALFGVGVIESILDDDIRAIAIRQAKETGSIKGIVAELPKRKVGKFGWRGEHSSVADFTAQACAIELGLSNSRHDQSSLPPDMKKTKRFMPFQKLPERFTAALRFVHLVILGPPRSELAPSDSTLEGEDEMTTPVSAKMVKEHDMSDQQLDDMVEFVNSLPALMPLGSHSKDKIETVANGRSHFETIGCADCHVRTVGPAVDVFSDFLLHDMGEELADAAGALRNMPTTKNVAVDKDRARLWQTPPLWGVAISAPYLHDGRAKDLPTAIAMHGGEAAESVTEFNKLSRPDKKSLLSFLGSLGDGANQNLGVASGVAVGGWSSPPPARRGELVGRR